MSLIYDSTPGFAAEMDRQDVLSGFREQFLFPEHNGLPARYFCGNSLGLQPRPVRSLIEGELDDWGRHGVEGHFRASRPWFSYHHFFEESLARIVGAEPTEVVAMNSLTVNLHLLMCSFYRPTPARYKIIMEAGAFPSDQYAMETQARMHSLDPMDAIIEVAPRPGEHLVDERDLLQAITDAGEELAVVLLGGVNYYTGQFFDLEAVTAAAHAVGAHAGFDLAHAVGNVPLRLHHWNVDFACWCTYKYLNSGPGSVGGAFVHEKHGNNPSFFRLAGWWGNEEKTRFKMEKGFLPQAGAASWQMSNAPVFNMVAHLASLRIFDEAGMDRLRDKSLALTGYMEYLLQQLKHIPFEIITPANPSQRGCQLSLLFRERGREIFDRLTAHGIIADWREPDVIRIAPAPLYNTFADCYHFFDTLRNLGA